MSEHQVNRSGVCEISGCPCRGWSAQETAGAIAFTDGTLRDIKDTNQLATTGEHEPAARGGGESWQLSSEAMNAFVKQKMGDTADGMPVFAIDVPDKEDRIHYAKIVVCGDQKLAQQIIDQNNQHHSLVAERERLQTTLTNTRATLDRFLFASGSRKASRDDLLELWRQVDNALADINEQGSTSA